MLNMTEHHLTIFLMRRLSLERSPGYTVARLGLGSGQPDSKAGTRTTLITLVWLQTLTDSLEALCCLTQPPGPVGEGWGMKRILHLSLQVVILRPDRESSLFL